MIELGPGRLECIRIGLAVLVLVHRTWGSLGIGATSLSHMGVEVIWGVFASAKRGPQVRRRTYRDRECTCEDWQSWVICAHVKEVDAPVESQKRHMDRKCERSTTCETGMAECR